MRISLDTALFSLDGPWQEQSKMYPAWAAVPNDVQTELSGSQLRFCARLEVAAPEILQQIQFLVCVQSYTLIS